MKPAAILILAMSLVACASGQQVSGGIATLDALRDAGAVCTAQGKKLKLKSGGDSQYLEDYACKRN